MFASVQVNDGHHVIASAVTAIGVRIVISNGNIPPLLISVAQLGQETALVTSGGGVAFTVSRPHHPFRHALNKGVQAPTEGNTGRAIAINKTGEPQGIAIGTQILYYGSFVLICFVLLGFIDAAGFPNPLLVWQNVGYLSRVLV